VKNYLIEIVKGFLPFYLFTFLLLSCGPGGNRFRIEGRLRHMNQAEFLIYSPDGGINGIDTIKVHEGRFAYETMLRDPATFIIIFPNFSELAVFGAPGKTAEIKGDASHMKEMTVKGTEDNEEMTKIRMELNRLVPPQIPDAVEAFIKEHRTSQASIYLLKRHFLSESQPDYRKAALLTKMLLTDMPDNGQLLQLDKQLKLLQGAALKRLPLFTAKDVKGRKVTEKDLKAKANVVSFWASWNYQSTDMQRRLKAKKEKYGDKLAIVSVCLDGSPAACKRTVVDRDSLKWSTVCDGKMWDSPLIAKFGVGDVPANVVIDQKGNIRDRNLSPQKLDEMLETMLKEEK
jgi:peroxiredoxin